MKYLLTIVQLSAGRSIENRAKTVMYQFLTDKKQYFFRPYCLIRLFHERVVNMQRKMKVILSMYKEYEFNVNQKVI